MENTGTERKELWSRDRSKAVSGICAILIVFHHMAQKTCAEWVPAEYRMHGLEPFIDIGYLLVGVFFFCSGYGLYKSLKSKPDYLKSFIGKHYGPIIFVFIIANIPFLAATEHLSSYSWYIYAILYLYAAFWISFKTCKNEKAAIAVMAGFILFYCLFCDYIVLGTWWYNSVWLFFVGLIFAKNSGEIAKFIEKYFIAAVITSTAATVGAFAGVEHLSEMVITSESFSAYTLLRIAVLFLQYLSEVSLMVFILTISTKMDYKVKALRFLGSMSLEIYMVHVIFVETFGYCFVNMDTGAVLYIENLPLYCLAVLSASILCAWGLMMLKKVMHLFREKIEDIRNAIKKDAKKLLIGLLVLLAVIVVYYAVKNAVTRSSKQELSEKYRAEFLKTVDIGSLNMSYYKAGSGERTIIVLRGMYDPCPTMTQRALADELAKDYTVIVPDFPGSGFSDDPVTERSADNIVAEIHSLTKALGLKKYTILAEGITAMYALKYANEYPGEVEACINFDGRNSAMGRSFIEAQKISAFEQKRINKRDSELKFIEYRILDFTGLKSVAWPFFEEIYLLGVHYSYKDCIDHVFFKRCQNASVRDEMQHEVENYIALEGMTYPKGIQVIDFESNGVERTFREYGIDIRDLLISTCPDTEYYSYKTINDSLYEICFKPEMLRNSLNECFNHE